MPLYFDGKKHLPAPSGKVLNISLSHWPYTFFIINIVLLVYILGTYVVGHADVMTGPTAEEGTLMRLFFPTELENIFVQLN